MARSVGFQFFMTPGETLEIVERIVDSTSVRVFSQLRRPGLILQPIGSSHISGSVHEELPPVRLLMTHHELPAGPERGTCDGFGAPLILLSMPFIVEDCFYLGDAGAKVADTRDPDAAVIRKLIRELKRQAPHSMLARNIRLDATGPANGLGCSDEALRLAEKSRLRFRQLAVENIEFVPTG